MGGSLGSTRVFEAVFETAKKMPGARFEVVLGKLNAPMRLKFSSLSNVVCHDFLSQEDLAKAYASSDLVVTRAGATSLAEIEASEADMVIIPLEGSANDHQRANAASYCEKGYAVLFEKDISNLAELVRSTLSKEAKKNPALWKNGVDTVVSHITRKA
ncbi:MAG: glycosyltransferase [Patescibacteria group bacterium]